MIYVEDCLKTMARLSDNFVDMVVTSPPYDSLRDYKGYVFDFESTAKELYRVLKTGGVIIWIVNDETIDGSESGTSFRQALYFKEVGFKLHDTMIWKKSNFSNPSKTRYHQIFEYMFVFSKGKPKTFNPIIDRENKYKGKTSFSGRTNRNRKGEMIPLGDKKVYSDYGMRYNIWIANTSGQENPCKKIEHPATFPEGLIRDHILSWSNPGDMIYDPFLGSGTTGKVAQDNGRLWFGSEISKEYVKIAAKRTGVTVEFENSEGNN